MNSGNNHSDDETKKKTIMICDDEQELLQVYGLALKSKYDVLLVDSGEECIDKYIQERNSGNKIDLILLDYRLGSMLGDSVARKIKECNGTRIILISAYDLDDDLITKLEGGNYITKYVARPIHVNDFAQSSV